MQPSSSGKRLPVSRAQIRAFLAPPGKDLTGMLHGGGMAVQNPPAGYHTLTPYLMLDDPRAFMTFLKQAFGAKQVGEIAEDGDGNVMHADYQIGDSHIMFGTANAQMPATGNSIHMYIDDCDGVFKKALAAGAKKVKDPMTEFYGDRSGCVRDRWDNTWWISTHVEDVPPAEMEKRQKKWVEQMQATST